MFTVPAFNLLSESKIATILIDQVTQFDQSSQVQAVGPTDWLTYVSIYRVIIKIVRVVYMY